MSKKISVLSTEVDGDSRIRSSFNITTETGRLSSSSSSFGTGTNLQNITEELRHIFIADPGWKLCGIDLEQTESRDVGFLHGTMLGDWTYLDAVESGDIHTAVCKQIWRNELPWTGNPKLDKELAEETKFYREYGYRFMAKKGGHSCNYMISPWTLSRHLKIPRLIAEEFQDSYYEAFPAFLAWFQASAQELQTTQMAITPFGRERTFFGRADDDATLREFIAYKPQSMSADRMNLGMWKLWRYGGNKIQLLAQVHDAVYFLYRQKDEHEIIPWALETIKIPLRDPKSGRIQIVPGEAKVGWNWGKFDPKNPTKNPYGLKTYDQSTPDERTEPRILDRIL